MHFFGALDPQIFIGGPSVIALASALVWLTARALRINDELYDERVEPLQDEAERLRREIREVRRANVILVHELQVNGIPIPEGGIV